MPSALPHGREIAENLKDYFDEIQSNISSTITCAGASASYRRAFKTSLAAATVLRRLGQRQLPILKNAKVIAQRCPLLLVARQISLAYVDLRRFVELVAWFPYFSEHPVEWEEVCQTSTQGFTRDSSHPIAYCSHREVYWYLNYVRERLARRGCRAVSNAVTTLSEQYASLSVHVHSARSVGLASPMSAPLESASETAFRTYQRAQESVFRSGCILVCWIRRNGLGALDAVSRAWFDWLVGKATAKAIRGGRFGLK